MNIKSLFQSSVDPTQLSLTWSSGAKMAIGVVGYLLMAKGIDPQPITSQLQLITEEVATVITAGFAVWHAMQTVYGIFRKFMVVKPIPAGSIANQN